jgi:uncharacterized protein YhbP (UPF0306 family)
MPKAPNTEETKKIINDYLRSHYQMVLATTGEFPWIATLYYSVGDDFTLYFLSNPNTVHCRHIALNKHVAIAIADAPQKPNAKKKGLQIYGTAEMIDEEHKITHALNLWKQTLGVTSSLYTYEQMMKNAIKGRMYKVTPKQIKFFNEELWDEGQEETIRF